MKPFSRGGFLVAIMDLFQSVMGIIIGCKGWALFRSISSDVTVPQESNIQFRLNQAGNSPSSWGSSFYNTRTPEEAEEYIASTTSAFYIFMALYFVVLLCVLSFAIVLIFGIRLGSSLKIKVWLYPNVGVIVLSGVVMLLYSIFKSIDIAYTATMCVLSVQVGGALIFRSLQCWIVYEALTEIPKEEMYALEQVGYAMPLPNKRAGIPSGMAGHLGNDSVI